MSNPQAEGPGAAPRAGSGGPRQHRQSGRSQRPGLATAWVSEIGPVREKNEDRFLVSPESGLLVVSDGMGGKPAGERAASLVVQWLPDLLTEQLAVLQDPTPREVEVLVRDAVLKLNTRVRREGRRVVETGTIGATLAMVLIRGNHFHVAHMGDSRVYLHDAHRLFQLTRDHTPLDVLIRRGAVTLEQAKDHPMRGVLSRYVGMRRNPEVDVTTVSWESGNRLLLCSDGLTDVVTDQQIKDALAGRDEILVASERLVRAATSAGTRDNVTVVMAQNTG
jgi:protein phosphatase